MWHRLLYEVYDVTSATDNNIRFPVSFHIIHYYFSLSTMAALDPSSFECPLCLKLLWDPTTSPCGHSFCKRCVYEMVEAAEASAASETDTTATAETTINRCLRCPLCRKVIQANQWQPSSSISLGRLLQAVFPAEYRARAAEDGAMPPLKARFALNTIPLFVLDPILPGQRLSLHIFEMRYRRLIHRAMMNEPRAFGMVGVGGYAQPGGQRQEQTAGTLVHIISCRELPDGRFHVLIQGNSVFRIAYRRRHRDGYDEAVLHKHALISDDSHTNDSRETGATSTDTQQNEHEADQELFYKVRETYLHWEHCVIHNRWERYKNQLRDARALLGDLPNGDGNISSDNANKLALWIAAAINPLPALGLVREIRPAVLNAKASSERLNIVFEAMSESLQIVERPAGRWNLGTWTSRDRKVVVWSIVGLIVWWFFQDFIRDNIVAMGVLANAAGPEVPSFVLHNGRTVPLVGLGCASGVRQAHIISALEIGYRFFDTAQSYHWGYHEDEVGKALRHVPLDDSDPVFVQTKIHPEDLGYNATLQAVNVSLKRLGVPFIDSVLIHKPRCWPGACQRDPEGSWQDSWRALEELVDAGVIGAIGICDVDDRLLDELLKQRIKPHIIQNWMDPFRQQTHIRDRCQQEGILFQGYSTLGTQWVHHRGYDINPVLNSPVLLGIAEKYGVGVAQVVINWAAQVHGVSVLPASTNADDKRPISVALILLCQVRMYRQLTHSMVKFQARPRRAPTKCLSFLKIVVTGRLNRTG